MHLPRVLLLQGQKGNETMEQLKACVPLPICHQEKNMASLFMELQRALMLATDYLAEARRLERKLDYLINNQPQTRDHNPQEQMG
jgi:hypothetical protein